MKLNDMLYDLLDLAEQENEPNRYAHSEEYDRLFDELDRKTLMLDELEEQFGSRLDIVLKIKFGDIHHVYDENGDKFCINWGEIFKSYFSVYRGTDFDFTVKIFKWEDYGKTWWTKEDRSE